MKYFKHEKAIVETDNIGEKTRIWAFAHVLSGASIGKNCNICDHVFIENDVVIGDDVTVKCGVQIWDGLVIEDGVFIGPNATFSNDKFPRSKQYPESFASTIIKRGASIGANATILPGLTIGAQAMIGAGAVVTRDVPPRAIVLGNPARIVGYADTQQVQPLEESSRLHKRSKPSVRGVSLHELSHVSDMRGNLCVTEWDKDLPFEPRRAFIVSDVPDAKIRGEHAHKECHQFLVCVKGSVVVVADDGRQREEYLLDEPWLGLYLPPRVWGIQYKYSPDAVLMVFASHPYDPDDYIRDYDDFLQLVNT